MSIGRSKRELLLALVGVAVISVAAVVTFTDLGGASGQLANGSPSTSTQIPESGLSQAEANGLSQMSAGGPELTLPASQRAAWIDAFQSMANCMHEHGIADFPNAPSTFGDGKTPAPSTDGAPGTDMDPQSSAYQAASAACPFDQSNLSIPDFQSAWNQWYSSHPNSAPGEAVSGQEAATP
jgi:hypothetical protein